MFPCREEEENHMTTDLSQVVVRRIGLESGLVDYRVCAIDGSWTRLKFARRDAAAGITRDVGRVVK
jgi:hypothetical protein